MMKMISHVAIGLDALCVCVSHRVFEDVSVLSELQQDV